MILCITVSVALVTAWVFTLSVSLSNVLAVCIAINCIALIQFNSLRTITFILIGFFVYDIFWVFISGSIFGSSVMISVAKGIGVSGQDQALPILLTFGTFINGDGYSLLGLGDILVPGLLLSYLFRVDRMHERMEIVRLKKMSSSVPEQQQQEQPESRDDDGDEESARAILSSTNAGGSSVNAFLQNQAVILPSVSLYFPGTLVFYLVALFITFLIVALFGSGQPALLYIVPLIHIFPLVRAYKLGQLKDLWSGSFTLLPGITQKETDYIMGEMGRSEKEDDIIGDEEEGKKQEGDDVSASSEKQDDDVPKESDEDKSIP